MFFLQPTTLWICLCPTITIYPFHKKPRHHENIDSLSRVNLLELYFDRKTVIIPSTSSCSRKVEYFNGHLRLWPNSRDFILFRLTALQPINVTLSKELQVFGNSEEKSCCFSAAEDRDLRGWGTEHLKVLKKSLRPSMIKMRF